MEITHFQDNQPFITKDGSQIRSIMDFANSTIRNQTLAHATVKPGRSTFWHIHKESEEIYYLLEGEGLIEMGSESAKVRSGDAIRIPIGSSHRITSTGQCDLVFLCCCSPGYSHEQTELLEENQS